MEYAAISVLCYTPVHIGHAQDAYIVWIEFFWMQGKWSSIPLSHYGTDY